jgi:predicted transcriptional regulator
MTDAEREELERIDFIAMVAAKWVTRDLTDEDFDIIEKLCEQDPRLEDDIKAAVGLLRGGQT